VNYASGRRAFSLACFALDLDPFPSSPLAAVDTLLRFIWFMGTRMLLRASSMSQYVASVRYMWHRSPLRSDPSSGSPLPSAYIDFFRANDKRPALFRRAFDREWLRYTLDLSDDPVVPLAFAIGFFFFLRVSEYCVTDKGSILRAENVLVASDCLVLDIPYSKTDKERRGSRHARRRTGGRMCLVALYEAYRASRPAGSADEPALVWRSGRPFTDDDLNALIKRVATHFGADPLLFSSHSLRSGGVTAMHAAGAPETVLIREGRWASIEGLLKYLRMDASAAADFAADMLPDSLAPRPRPPKAPRVPLR